MTENLLSNPWLIVLGIVYIVLVVADIAVVMVQQSKQSGLGALSGETNSYFQGNTGKTKDSILNKITVVISLLIVVLTVVLNVII